MAFCANCGNKLEDEALFCSSCGTQIQKEQEEKKEDGYNQQCSPTTQEGGVYGLGGAIAAAILGFLGFCFSIAAEIFAISALDDSLYVYFQFFYYTYALDDGISSEASAITAIILAFIAVALSTVGVILGIKAIGNFKKGKSLGRNPIGTLIVGIGGLAFGAMGVLMSLVVFFSAATCL